MVMSFRSGRSSDSLEQLHPEFTLQLLPEERLSTTFVARQSDLAESIVYLSGPAPMVDAIAEELLAQGLPEEHLRRDWFTGRQGWDEVTA